MGSLLDGIDVSPEGQRSAKATSAPARSNKTVKLVIAIVGLVVGGTLIAWNMGVFGSAPESTPTPALTGDDTSQPVPSNPAQRRPNQTPVFGLQPPVRP